MKDRKTWIVQCFLASAVLALAGGTVSGAAAQETQPNIVFIMVDDMGYGELGVTGQMDRADSGLPAILTPNIDALATGGMMIENFYATPICASTRGSLLTGFHNGHSSIDRNGGNNGGNALRSVDTTWGETLQSAGYTTGAYGKWGVGGFDHTVLGIGVDDENNAAITHADATPSARGFDEFYGYLNQVHAHDYYVDFLWEHDTDNSGDVGGMQVDLVSDSDYAHDLMADRSLQFITDHAGDDPFMLYLPYTIPHGNFDPPQDAVWQAFKDAGYTNAQADYAAMMARMDSSVGDMIARLQDPNQDGDTSDSVYDNTVIMFMSDNGGTPGENNLFGGDNGLRGVKGSVYEGGTASPFIAHWNGTITPGQVDSTTIGGLDDLFATFVDLAGADTPVGLDGTSLAGLFTGGERDERDIFIFEGNGSARAIRIGDWKLVGSSELYNLATDRGETTNVGGSHTTIRDLLNQIALDEGVLSDAGTGGAQTTHIVQYKQWAPAVGSTNFADNGNWSGGTQFNTRGTAVNNFATGPANNWITSIDNTAGGMLETRVSANTEVLAFELKGSAGQMDLVVESGATLTARNGARVHAGGRVHLDGGRLNTLRDIDVRQGGELSGHGTIGQIYDTTGTLFRLEADLVNAGKVTVGGEGTPSGGGTQLTELVANGGFEQGTGQDFDDITAWFNFTDGQGDISGRNTSNPAAGSFRAVVGVNSNGNTPAPAQDTGHTIALGEQYALAFDHAAASGWSQANDQIRATIYYLDNGSAVDLDSITVSPQQGYNNASTTFAAIADADAVGQSLFVRFEALVPNPTGFAALDSVSLGLSEFVPGGMTTLTVEGDYTQHATGTLAVDLFDEDNGQPAHDQLVVEGLASLAGTLEVGLGAGYDPDAGDSFVVIDAEQYAGAFDHVLLPELLAGRFWDLSELDAAGTLHVTDELRGDLNGDGFIGLADLDVLLANWGLATSTGDVSGDGVVSTADLDIVRANWGLGAAPGSNVPEPGSAAALAIGGLLLTRRSR